MLNFFIVLTGFSCALWQFVMFWGQPARREQIRFIDVRQTNEVVQIQMVYYTNRINPAAYELLQGDRITFQTNYMTFVSTTNNWVFRGGDVTNATVWPPYEVH